MYHFSIPNLFLFQQALFKINPLTAALNGGEDYELLMAISQSNYEKVKNHPFLTVIGHFTRKKSSAKLITSLNQEIDLTAQGWNSISESN